MAKVSGERLAALRKEMKRQGLSGFIVPRQDEFQGEYVAPYAERLKWLTGFSGSWGVAVVLATKAAIFVDGRYTTQVRQQVKSKAFAFESLTDTPPSDWLKRNLKRADKIGYDPALHTIAAARHLAAACQSVGAKLIPVKRNLIDAIWPDQPARPKPQLFAQPLKFAGQTSAAKLKGIAKGLRAAKADAVVLGEPSSVAWAFNLRGRDVPYTPVVLAHALIHANGKAEVFTAPGKLEAKLKLLAAKKVLVDENVIGDNIRLALVKARAMAVHASDPCSLPKACKNKVEQKGARAAQLRDGAALTRFLHWFAAEAPKGELHEADVAVKLLAFRRETGVLEDLSFETIAAAGPNAALPHYHITGARGRMVKRDEIFLIDSGGQYRDGTTDVTRTVIVGHASPEMKDRFTRVLKGMIALSTLRFPMGTTGAHIDALARAALWAGGFNFDHGTGHGVGSFLSVHEGPARISSAGHAPLRPGMILSNEPGYYKAGHYGIRTENLLLVQEAAAITGGDRKMLGFETLTLAPIDRALIDESLLSRDELRWLDAYHQRVLREVGSLVDDATRVWLEAACAPLPRA